MPTGAAGSWSTSPPSTAHPTEKATHEAWVDGFVDAIRQGDGGAYVNFLPADGTDQVRSAYPGATWDRLREIKRQVDPENLFRGNQNVPPADA